MGFDGRVTRKEFFGLAAGAALLPGAAQAVPFEPSDDTIEVSDLEVADKVAGIELTPSQRQLCLAKVRENRKNYDTVRKLRLPNNLEPRLVFTPLATARYKSPKLSKLSIGVTAPQSSDEDVAFQSVAGLSALIRSKEISPVELTKLYLKRLESYDPRLHCVVTLTAELALKQAKKAEEEVMARELRGPLHGVPYGIKDLFSVAGYRTTWGAEAFKDQEFDFDAAVVEKLSQAGAVCLAKLSCGALAYDDVWFGGQTKNPWNLRQGSSGSSAGSASATSAGLVGFSIGTETLGSILSPSNRCRVSGLRPSYGRVSRFGGMTLTWTMDKVGPICRTAEDTALVLQAIAGWDERDLATTRAPLTIGNFKDWKSLKIGVLTDDKESPIETADWAKELKDRGANLRPVKFTSPIDAIWVLLGVEAAAFFDELTRSEGIDKIGKLWPPEFLSARYVPAVDYLNAHRARAQLSVDFEKEWGDLDVVVTDHFWDDVFTTCNGTGHPQAIIPWGVGSNGEPKSVSVIGRLFQEGTVAAVAAALQRTQVHHLKRPPI